MLEGVWAYAASIQASLIFGFVCMWILLSKITPNDKNGTRAQKAAGVVALFAGLYTYTILVVSNYSNVYTVSQLIDGGFGNDRIAFLIVMVVAEQSIRVIDLLRA